jgi:glutamyl-tRNA synthetase
LNTYLIDELIQAFNLGRIIKSPAVFDMDRLKWVNSQHLKNVTQSDLEIMVKNILETADPPILSPSSDTSNDMLKRVISLVTKISQSSSMELVTDARKELLAVLSYPLEETMTNDPHVSEILDDSYDTVVNALLRDFDSGVLPTGSEENFSELWKAYMKSLGKELGRKGKRLFHPVRLALTGAMSGPDVGEQLQLLSACNGVLSDAITITTIGERIKKLKSTFVKDTV